VVSSAQTRVESESALGRVEEKEEEVGEGEGEVRMGKTLGKIWMNQRRRQLGYKFLPVPDVSLYMEAFDDPHRRPAHHLA
jgi:hypothetical protein